MRLRQFKLQKLLLEMNSGYDDNQHVRLKERYVVRCLFYITDERSFQNFLVAYLLRQLIATHVALHEVATHVALHEVIYSLLV